MLRYKCDTCIFWGREREDNYDYPYGTCRKDTPKFFGEHRVLPYHDPDRLDEPGPLIPLGDWPWVAFDDWCGGYKARVFDG